MADCQVNSDRLIHLFMLDYEARGLSGPLAQIPPAITLADPAGQPMLGRPADGRWWWRDLRCQPEGEGGGPSQGMEASPPQPPPPVPSATPNPGTCAEPECDLDRQRRKAEPRVRRLWGAPKDRAREMQFNQEPKDIVIPERCVVSGVLLAGAETSGPWSLTFVPIIPPRDMCFGDVWVISLRTRA
jgi:hypothetical protein